jgi:hypothetical protein
LLWARFFDFNTKPRSLDIFGATNLGPGMFKEEPTVMKTSIGLKDCDRSKRPPQELTHVCVHLEL